jgi:hypothetical protein
VLEYASDVTVFNPDHARRSAFNLDAQRTIHDARMSHRSDSDRDGCQFMFKPHDISQPNGTAYRDVGPYRIYSEGNFDPCNTTDECTTRARAVASIRLSSVGAAT